MIQVSELRFDFCVMMRQSYLEETGKNDESE